MYIGYMYIGEKVDAFTCATCAIRLKTLIQQSFEHAHDTKMTCA